MKPETKTLFIAYLIPLTLGILLGGSIACAIIAPHLEANPLTPDNREFLHGYKLDLPEELTGNDTTHLLGIKDSVNHIYQIIIP